MFAFWKEIPIIVRVVGILLVSLALIAAYQFGYINANKSNKS